MKKYLLVALAVFISACTTLEVNVDYDSEYNFKSFSNFSVIYAKENNQKDFIKGRIATALTRYIENKGYKKVEENVADFYFTIHLNVEKNTQVETNYETMGIQPRRYYPRDINVPGRRPFNTMEYNNQDVRVITEIHEYKEGKLIVEVFDVKKKEIVWQAIATDELTGGMSQKEKTAYINKIIDLMFKDFPSTK